jgi:hypothetical protein
LATARDREKVRSAAPRSENLSLRSLSLDTALDRSGEVREKPRPVKCAQAFFVRAPAVVVRATDAVHRSAMRASPQARVLSLRCKGEHILEAWPCSPNAVWNKLIPHGTVSSLGGRQHETFLMFGSAHVAAVDAAALLERMWPFLAGRLRRRPARSSYHLRDRPMSWIGFENAPRCFAAIIEG